MKIAFALVFVLACGCGESCGGDAHDDGGSSPGGGGDMAQSSGADATVTLFEHTLFNCGGGAHTRENLATVTLPASGT